MRMDDLNLTGRDRMKDAQWAMMADGGPGDARGGPGVSVELLLATHNSAAFLRPLLESLVRQSFADFQLVVSDDCSTDETVAVLQEFAGRFQHPVQITLRDKASGSAKANFAGLLQDSRAEFVFFCDADDVWHPDKLETFLRRALAMQAEIGPDVPLFLFSDATIINESGAALNQSYWEFKKTDPARCHRLARLLVCTPMIGCATLMNRALVQLARDVPVDKVTGHDWWALLVAACFGRVDFLPERTVSYRLHGSNSSKPLRVSLRGMFGMAHWRHEMTRRMTIRQVQAQSLLDAFGARLPEDVRAELSRFVAMGQQSFLIRRMTMMRYGYTFPDWRRNAGLFLFG